MTVGASEFRKNIAAHLDQVLSGAPVAVIRNKRITAVLVRATRQAVKELLDSMDKEEKGSDVQPV